MTKVRKKKTLPQRFLYQKLGCVFKKYYTPLRRVATCGLFALIVFFLVQQHTYRFNLRYAPPSESEIKISYFEPEIDVEPVKSIEAETEWLHNQQDENYLNQALIVDEPVEEQYVIAEKIEQGVSFPEQAVNADAVKTVNVEALQTITEEEDYSRYEEQLPHDVIEENNLPAKKSENKVQPLPEKEKLPVIAIVIDDMGDNVKRTKDISSLKAPLTASFLTYPPHIDRQISRSIKAGHEIIVHVPMQPKSNINTSEDILTVAMSPDEVRNNFIRMMKKFKKVKGINNHMGSRLTEDTPRMEEIMKELKKRDLFFLDSKTTSRSVGRQTAEKYGVSYASRNVFLDNTNELKYILGQLSQAEKIARKNGYAIAIGHPKSQTYEALKQWLPTLNKKQIKLVHLSQIVSTLNPPSK